VKHSHAPAVTSLPQAPRDEASARVRNYWITMGIRMACFALTVLVTPYGWYTWVFAIAAAILPYIAVVFANAVSPTATSPAESPVQQLTTSTPAENSAQTDPTVITIQERQTPGDDEK
jgi:cytochrome c-type biogenesis protein CcmH/NrfG